MSAADWPTYDHDPRRSAAATGVPAPGILRLAWHRPLDGAVYAQPLVIGGVIVAATEGGSIYALNAQSGEVIWRRHIAAPVPLSDLPCGNIDPLGITGTPVYDPATGLVFAVAETTGGTHLLAGVNLATGELKVRREVEPPRGTPIATQQRPALTLYGGRVYIAFGGLYGDCADYTGGVVSVSTSGAGALDSYSVPTSREGAIWGTGGVVVADGRLFVSVGNGASTSSYDGSDSVTALSPALRRIDLFAPSSWAHDNANDLDLGSMTPAVSAAYVFVAGKSGTGYVLRATHLGGIGGQVAQVQHLRRVRDGGGLRRRRLRTVQGHRHPAGDHRRGRHAAPRLDRRGGAGSWIPRHRRRRGLGRRLRRRRPLRAQPRRRQHQSQRPHRHGAPLRRAEPFRGARLRRNARRSSSNQRGVTAACARSRAYP